MALENLDSSTLIPVSNVIDTSIIKNMKTDSPEFKRFMISLVENVNSILLAVNAKDVGIYNDKETLTGQNFFSKEDDNIQRPVFRRVIDFGALPDTTNKQVAHELDSTWSYKFTRIYAVTSDSANKDYLPIPYATSTAIDIIELFVDDTYVNITTGKDRTSFDTTYCVIEYSEI